MKTLLKWCSVLLLAVLGVQVLAQTNLLTSTNAAPLPGSGEAASAPSDFWALGIGLVTPLIVYGVRSLVPKIPTVLLPVMTPLIGVVLGLAMNWIATANLSWLDAAQAGALAVFFREVFNQAVTKQLEAKPPIQPPG